MSVFKKRKKRDGEIKNKRVDLDGKCRFFAARLRFARVLREREREKQRARD